MRFITLFGDRSLLQMSFDRLRGLVPPERVLVLTNAAHVALTMQVPLLIVIVAGMITGCVGGVLRDVLCNDVPLLFRSELYASVSVVVGIIYVGGVWLHLNHDLVVLVTLAIGLTFRLLAIAFKWEMPKFVYDADLH